MPFHRAFRCLAGHAGCCPEGMTRTLSPLGSQVVKQCPKCHRGFTLQEVLDSAEIQPIGMAFEPGAFENNLYYFNHGCPGCGSTFVLPVEQFVPYILEEIPPSVLDGSSACERHCRKLRDLEACGQPCFYAPFHRFLLERLVKQRAVRQRPTG